MTDMQHAFAIVEAVHADGLQLRFDGEDAAGEKHYKCNTFFKFAAGDRVYCLKDSGTFVAICKIGTPAQTITADTATTAETATTATNAEKATNADYAATAQTATNADKATSATNATNADKATSATNADKATSATNADKADALKLIYGTSSTSVYTIEFRYNTTTSMVEYRTDLYGQTDWKPLISPLDENASNYYKNQPIRFRTDSSGKLQYLAPYRSTTTWHTITST